MLKIIWLEKSIIRRYDIMILGRYDGRNVLNLTVVKVVPYV